MSSGPARERLPDRRPAMHCRVAWQPRLGEPPAEIELGVGFHLDGRVGEVFMAARKSEYDALLSDAAILISYLLQHGVAPAALAGTVGRQEQSEADRQAGRAVLPMTPIGAIVDLLAQLELERARPAGAAP